MGTKKYKVAFPLSLLYTAVSLKEAGQLVSSSTVFFFKKIVNN